MIKVGKQEAEIPLWHPNFGDASELPDVKVVRTGFFFSAIAVTLALITSMYVGFREYQMMELEKNIALLEEEIEGYKPRHSEVINYNRTFLDLRKNIEELDSFLGNQLVFSDFLLTVSTALSDEMAISRVEYDGERATITGHIHSDADAASQIFDNYKSKLSNVNASQSLFDTYEAKSLRRKKGMGYLEFDLEMSKSEEDKDEEN